MKTDLLENPHIKAAVYFTDQGHFLFKYKEEDGVVTKSLRTREVSAAFTLEGEDSGWIKSGIQRVGFNALGDWFVYYAPACTKAITLGKAKPITVPIPSMLLVGFNQRHYLFAMAGKDFNPRGKLYQAPFPNVYPDGQICWGNNEKPKIDASTADEVLGLFFNSPFNADLIKSKSKTFPDDIRSQLKALEGKLTYPTITLFPLSNSAEEWLRNRLQERS